MAPRPTKDDPDEGAKPDARLRRKQLELEREKILLEQQRVELELAKAKIRLDADEESHEESSDPVVVPVKAPNKPRPRPRPSPTELGAPAPPPRSRRRSSPNMTAMAALGGILGVASIGALLYFFGDRDKIPFAAGPDKPTPRAIPLPQLPKNPSAELTRLRQKATGGDAEAMITIGNLIAEGIGGGQPDAALAGEWYQLASKEGDPAQSEEAIRRLDGLLKAELEAKKRAEDLAKLEAQRRARAEAREREQDDDRRIAAEIKKSRASEEELARAKRVKELEDQIAALVVGNPKIEPEDYPPFSQQLNRIARDPMADEGVKKLVARRLEEFRAKLVSGLTTQAEDHMARGEDGQALAQIERFRLLGGPLPPAAAALEKQIAERARAEAEANRKARTAQSNAASRKKSRVLARYHIDAAVRWLVAHQHQDGRWSSNGWTSNCRKRPICRGPGNAFGDARFDAGLTGLALLVFLESGHTPNRGRYQESVRRGLTWLQKRQADTGAIAYRHSEEIYNHAIATRALCRAVAVFPDPDLERAAKRAIEYCLVAQKPGSGWKYQAGSGRSDTSVTGWMVTALKAGKEAGLQVPESAFKGA